MDVLIRIIPFSLSIAVMSFYLLDYYGRQRKIKNYYEEGQTETEKENISFFHTLFTKWAVFFKNRKAVTYRSYLEDRFLQAGIEKKYTPEVFWSFQIFMAFAFLIIYFALSYYMNFFDIDLLPRTWIAASILLCIGFLYPLFWLSQKINTRKNEIMILFPDFVSTLALSVEAGLDYFGAMVRYIENSEKSDLRYEIEKVINDVRLGSNREVALKDFAKRIKVQAVQNFVAVLVQATQLGTSIGVVLKAQTEKLRRERFEKAERAGAIAAQKILFPLIFFIMPSVFLLIFGPLIVKLVTGGFNALL